MPLLPPGIDTIHVRDPEPVKRTWRERLFTRPWRPFVAEKPGPQSVLHELVEKSNGLMMFQGKLYYNARMLMENPQATGARSEFIEAMLRPSVKPRKEAMLPWNEVAP